MEFNFCIFVVKPLQYFEHSSSLHARGMLLFVHIVVKQLQHFIIVKQSFQNNLI